MSVSARRPAAEGDVVFTTSGSTDEPARWRRSQVQLAAEVDLLTGTVLGEVRQVVCMAPPRHLFGRLFGVELPKRRGVEVHRAWEDPLVPPRWRPHLPTLFVCLPSSWAVLRGMVSDIATLPRSVAVHSTGPPTAYTHQTVRALRPYPFRAVELLGSTETGAVATREVSADAEEEVPWQLLPDVTAEGTRDDGELPLTVRSPRLARPDGVAAPPDTWQMDDLVRMVGARRFLRVGRASRLLKVNGVRCDLGWIERRIALRMPALEAVCLPQRDVVRGECYELVYAGVAQAADTTELWNALREALGPRTPLPRSVRRVPVIPRGPAGKPQHHLLAARPGPVQTQRVDIAGAQS